MLRFSCRESDWQLSSLTQLCSSALPLPSTLERLNIHEHPFWGTDWQGDMENTQWMEIFDLFPARSLPVQWDCSTCGTRTARGGQGTSSNGHVTLTTKYFCRGASTNQSCSRSHSAIHRLAIAFRSPVDRRLLGMKST